MENKTVTETPDINVTLAGLNFSEEEKQQLEKELENGQSSPLVEVLLGLVQELHASRLAASARPAGRGTKVTSTTYKRLGPLGTSAAAPKIPQQQRDLAAILTAGMTANEVYTEAQVFELLNREYTKYDSLRNSRQSVETLFRYYRNLKEDLPHAGFEARGFLEVSK